DGSLRLLGPEGPARELVYRGPGRPEFPDGPLGQVLQLEGQDRSFVEANPAENLSLERTDRFSFGGWVRPNGDGGTVLRQMDDGEALRGFDLVVSEKVEVHLIHTWPGSDILVTTRDALPKNSWSHVFVTYDGSGRAAGVAIYLNGRPAELSTSSDSLRGSI